MGELCKWHSQQLILKNDLICEQAPVPVKPWEGIRSAEDYGQSCPTYPRLAKMSEAERKMGDIEDCLNLDIYTKQVE